MSFPVNPSNDEIYINSLGTQYKYVSADSKWIIESKAVLGNQGVTGLQGVTGTQGVKGDTGIDYSVTGIINISYNNGSTPIAPFTGLVGEFEMPYKFRVNGWDMWCASGCTGYIRTTVNNQTFANYTNKLGDTSMSGLTGPWLNGHLKNTGVTTSWAGPTGAAGDIVSIWANYVTGVSNFNVALKYSKW